MDIPYLIYSETLLLNSLTNKKKNQTIRLLHFNKFKAHLYFLLYPMVKWIDEIAQTKSSRGKDKEVCEKEAPQQIRRILKTPNQIPVPLSFY